MALPSILSLGSKEAVDELVANPDDFASAFVEYPLEQQAVLLKEMSKRMAEMQEAERNWDIITERGTATDLQIFTHRSNWGVKANQERKRPQALWSWSTSDSENESGGYQVCPSSISTLDSSTQNRVQAPTHLCSCNTLTSSNMSGALMTGTWLLT